MSSKKIAKTNAARLLERLEIPFTLHQADVDESDLSAVTMAHKLGVDPGCVFKTLVARGDKTGVRSSVKSAESSRMDCWIITSPTKAVQRWTVLPIGRRSTKYPRSECLKYD